MKSLEGKTISSIRVSDDQHVLCFDTESGPICFFAESDCCSESWFADITGVDALIGGTVADVQEISNLDYNVDDGRTRQEVDIAYGYKIVTDKGYAEIVFRNSSNGYYGGFLVDYDGTDPESTTKKIIADWSA